MSDTPRTDRNEGFRSLNTQFVTMKGAGEVTSDFARTLEREIQVLREYLDAANNELDEARYLAALFRKAWMDEHKGAFFVGTTLPWDKKLDNLTIKNENPETL